MRTTDVRRALRVVQRTNPSKNLKTNAVSINDKRRERKRYTNVIEPNALANRTNEENQKLQKDVEFLQLGIKAISDEIVPM